MLYTVFLQASKLEKIMKITRKNTFIVFVENKYTYKWTQLVQTHVVQQSTVYTIAPFAFYPNDRAILCMYMELNKNKDDFLNADNFAYGFGMHNRVFCNN